MSKTRKFIGFLLIAVGVGVIALSVWDKPVPLLFMDLEINIFSGPDDWGLYNSIFLVLGIIIALIGAVLSIVKSTQEVKEENAMKHNLDAQKEINVKLEERVDDEKKRYDKLKKQLSVKRNLEMQKKKAMQSSLKKGTDFFEAGKYEEAITQWEDSLAVENKTFIESIRGAKVKLDKIKSAMSEGEKRCPYCQADLMGFEEQCPQCFENLLSNEDIVKKSLQAGLEKYVEEEYSEAISAWTKVLAVDPGHEMAAKYIMNAEEKLEAGVAPMEEEIMGEDTAPTDVFDEGDMALNGEAGIPDVAEGVPEVEEALGDLAEGEAGGEVAEGDLQGMDIGDLDLDESDDMDSIEDMLSEIGVGGEKMKPEEVSGETAPIPDLQAGEGGSSDEMYECEVCGAVMNPDQLTCPKCGTEYDE
jgi:tetratricopeptide (TPR) repeat protein